MIRQTVECFFIHYHELVQRGSGFFQSSDFFYVRVSIRVGTENRFVIREKQSAFFGFYSGEFRAAHAKNESGFVFHEYDFSRIVVNEGADISTKRLRGRFHAGVRDHVHSGADFCEG